MMALLRWNTAYVPFAAIHRPCQVDSSTLGVGHEHTRPFLWRAVAPAMLLAVSCGDNI